MDNTKEVCSVCHQAVKEEYFFCPNCGHNLKEAVLPVSVLKQIGLYALAVILPPWGFYPEIKYILKNSPQAKRVGLITVLLTTLSMALMLWLIFRELNVYLDQFSALGL